MVLAVFHAFQLQAIGIQKVHRVIPGDGNIDVPSHDVSGEESTFPPPGIIIVIIFRDRIDDGGSELFDKESLQLVEILPVS